MIINKSGSVHLCVPPPLFTFYSHSHTALNYSSVSRFSLEKRPGRNIWIANRRPIFNGRRERWCNSASIDFNFTRRWCERSRRRHAPFPLFRNLTHSVDASLQIVCRITRQCLRSPPRAAQIRLQITSGAYVCVHAEREQTFLIMRTGIASRALGTCPNCGRIVCFQGRPSATLVYLHRCGAARDQRCHFYTWAFLGDSANGPTVCPLADYKTLANKIYLFSMTF